MCSEGLLMPGNAVGEQAPRGGVPGGREEVPPVLDHEPRPGGGGGERRPAQVPGVGEPAGEERGEHREAEGELVHAQPADEDPRPEPMAFQPQHSAKVVGKITFRIKTC